MDYFAAAEEYLNQGRFYKAADTYSLAALWQPENSLAYAGQCWALFGAGEYMSSAYYLSRALVQNPKLAEQKINIAAILRDRDVFENRLIEMAGSQERSKSGEMAFLLAYVLWQDGKIQRAEDMIKLAAERMPEDAAVNTLLAVITAPASTETPPAEPSIADPNQIGK
jgi:tetratricopeptide (TPR) repeat protein